MRFLNKTLYRVLLVLFSFAFLMMIFEPYTDVGFVEPLSVVLLAILLFVLLRKLFNKLKKLSEKTLKIIIASAFIVFVGFQVISVSQAQIQIFGDPWHTLNQALRLSKGIDVWDPWVQYYPNLLPFMGLQFLFIKLSSFLNVSYYVVFYAFTILINTSIWAVLVGLIWHKKAYLGAFLSIVMLLIPMNYDFILRIGYTDGIAILMLSLFAIVLNLTLKDKRFPMKRFIGLTIIFLLAYLARPNVIVVVVALLIFSLVAYFNQEKYDEIWKSFLKMFLACLIGIVLAMGVSRGLASAMNYDLNDPKVFPTVNWFYESLNFESMGEWTATDRNYTLLHPGYATAKEADLSGIKSRLTDLVKAPWKIPVLYTVKFASLWSCGTFATGTDYQLFSQMYHWSHAPSFLVENIGAINIFFETYAKALMGLFLLAIVLEIKKRREISASLFGFSILIIIGVSLFHTFLWEVKPRYQYMTIGLIMVAGSLSFKNFFEQTPHLVKQKFKNKKNIWYGLIALSLLSIGLMSTVMRLQTEQMIVVNSQFQPLDNYTPGSAKFNLAAHEQLIQKVHLANNADEFVLQSQSSDPFQLIIERQEKETWKKVYSQNVPALQMETQIKHHFMKGNYRILIKNPTADKITISAMTDTEVLDYPNKISQGDQKLSLGFQFSQNDLQNKYPFGLIMVFALLDLLLIILLKKTLL
ncbi:hypothetical protein [Lactococcus fujiensis]|uniref:hypothetical protein n=2 Tax=Lactococcus fujiensis TaxID=610251 RepID=UPI000BDF248B|nr:hypothetical protein [Lactococcus fujiensis]